MVQFVRGLQRRADRPWFGPGTADVPVRTGRWAGIFDFTPQAHTAYWWLPKDGAATSAVTLLRTVLDLSGDSVFDDQDEGESGESEPVDEQAGGASPDGGSDHA